ncbi:MAG: CHAT domain-containing protein, partial [Umezawaea sp.]
MFATLVRVQQLDFDFRASGDLSVLATALDLAERAFKTAGDDTELLVAAHGVQGRLRLLRYATTHDLADLDAAIASAEFAAGHFDDGDENLHANLDTLGNALIERFEHTDDLATLGRGIAVRRRLADLTPAEHRAAAGRFANLSTAHLDRHVRLGEEADLHAAVDAGERARRAIGPNTADPALCLTPLAIALQVRAAATGSLEDLRRAVEVGERAVAATPAGHPELTGRQSNLGLAYVALFRLTRSMAEVNHAVDLLEIAVADTPPSDLARPKYLSNLGTALRWRFERTGDRADLVRSLDFGERALAATPPDHPEHLKFTNNLVNAYRAAHQRGKVVEHIARAIELGEGLLARTPSGHGELARWTSNLAIAYLVRHTTLQDLESLARGIELGERALALLPNDDPVRGLVLSTLYSGYQQRFDSTGQEVADDELRAAARWVETATPLSPVHGVMTGFVVGRLANATGRHDVAARVLALTATRLSAVAPPELARADQEHELADHRGLAAEVVAAHLWQDDVVSALEVSELARGVLFAAELDARSDLTAVAEVEPALAEDFESARGALAGPLRAGLAESYEHVLTKVRALPGFAKFQLPQGFDELRQAVGDGALVLVSASPTRSDAVVVTRDDDPIVVRLPDLRAADVEERAELLLAGTHDVSTWAEEIRKQGLVADTLAWLWDAVVARALDALPAHVRRVWWLPVGAAGLLPLHAAGHVDEAGALDRVVSSYLPTMRALSHVRSRPVPVARDQLTVTMATTPGLAPLPHTATEAAVLATRTGPLADDEATTAAVRAGLLASTWSHFACHAGIDRSAPSHGGLHLHDGVLTIAEV